MPGGDVVTTYTKRKLSAARYLLALPLIAIFAIPGAAEQPGVMTPKQRLAAMQQELGVTLDPHAAVPLTIEVPQRYKAEHAELALRFI